MKLLRGILTASPFLVALACSSKNQCTAGYAGCACTVESTCLTGLVCGGDGICRDPNAQLGSGGGSVGNGGGPGIDVAQCTGCMDSACPEARQACEAQSGCAEALGCLTTCQNDPASCQSCGTALTEEAVPAYLEFSQCVALACLEACTPDVVPGGTGGAAPGGTGGAPDGTGGSPSGESCTPGQLRGACVSNNAQYCVDGSWESEDCDGCGVLSPLSACGRITAFVLDPLADWSAVPDAVTSFTQSDGQVSATFDFTASGQVGVIQFQFTEAIMPYGATLVSLPSSSNLRLSLEANEGNSGCQYSFSGDEAYQTLDDGCWPVDSGGVASYFPFEEGLPSSPATHANVRLTASGAGSQGLTVMYLSFQ